MSRLSVNRWRHNTSAEGTRRVVEPQFAVRMFNWLPAILVEAQRPVVSFATRYAIHFDVNDQGRIR